jgi:hypothetical protein
MNCSVCGTPVAPGAQSCPRCGSSLPGQAGAFSQTKDKSTSQAKWSLWISVFSIPCCCGPLALVGALLGLLSIRSAKSQGRPAPKKAVAAVAIAVIVMMMFAVAMVLYIVKQRKLEQRKQAVQTRLAGKRDAPTIDRQTACDLVEVALLDGLYEGRKDPGKVECSGDFEAGSDHAVLRDVVVDFKGEETRFTACLARASRWFALKTTKSGECPSGPWAASGAKTENALEQEEKRLRGEEQERVYRELLSQYNETMLKIRKAVSSIKRKERECPKLDLTPFLADKSDRRLKLPTVDLEFLNASADDKAREPDAQWSFMTSKSVRTALNENAPLKERAEAVRDMYAEGGPYVVVYDPALRTWPEVKKEKDVVVGFVGGVFLGTMIVVDERTATPVCEARFVFKNSETVKYGKRGLSSEDARLDRAVAEDLKKQYEKTAVEDIKKLSNDQFRLGLKLLE